jgi:hypothetical protein
VNTPVVITIPLWLVWLVIALFGCAVVLLKCIQVQLRLLYELYELLRDGDQP